MSREMHLGDAMVGAIRQFQSDITGGKRDIKGEFGEFFAQESFVTHRFETQTAPALGLSDHMARSECDRGREAIGVCASHAESPLERIIAPHLIFQFYGEKLRTPAAAFYPDGVGESFPRSAVVVVPQMQFGGIRPDFLIVAKCAGQMKMVAFECDGFAYHDVRKDSVRDDYLDGWGITTIRASGSEITNAPAAAAAGVADVLVAWADALT